VYYAVHIDGAQGLLRLVSARPATEAEIAAAAANDTSLVSSSSSGACDANCDPAVRLLTWRLSEIGVATDVLNDGWHQLRFVFTKRNGNVAVQLVVDGRTTTDSTGWIQCMGSQGVRAVGVLPAVVHIKDTQRESVYQGGLLTVGYFNGGVYGITVDPYVVPTGSLHEGGVPDSTADTTTVIYSGIMLGLVLAAGFMLAFAALTLIALNALRRREELYAFREARVVYQQRIWPLSWERSSRYRMLPLQHVLALLGDHGVGTSFLSDVNAALDGLAHKFDSIDHQDDDLPELDMAAGIGSKPLTAKQFLRAYDAMIRTCGEPRESLLRALWWAYRNVAHDVLAPAVPMAHAPTGQTSSCVSPVMIHGEECKISPLLDELTLPTPEEWNRAVEKIAGEQTQRLPEDYEVGIFGPESGRKKQDATHIESVEDDDIEMAAAPKEETGVSLFDLAKKTVDKVTDVAKAAADVAVTVVATKIGVSVSLNAEEEIDAAVEEHEQVDAIAHPKRLAFLVPDVQLVTVLEACAHVLQNIAVYVSVAQFPLVYSTSLGKTTQFLALDFSQAFELSPLVTPLLQCSAAVLLAVVLVYVAIVDDRRFQYNLALFTRRRDRIDAARVKDVARARAAGADAAAAAVAPHTLDDWTDDSVPAGETVLVQLLDPLDRLYVERFARGLDRNDELILGPSDASIRITLPSGREVDVTKTTLGGLTAQVLSGGPSPKEGFLGDDGDGSTFDVHELGAFCPCHPHSILTPNVQNDVFPFFGRRSCCAVEWGLPCNRAIGTIHVCDEPGDVDGKSVQCMYALCDRHFQASFTESVLSNLKDYQRQVQYSGIAYYIARFLVVACVALYTPVMRTVLVLFGCHPFFQCTYGRCLQNPTYTFTMSFYAALVALFAFGIGVPVFTVYTVVRRRRAVQHAFRVDDPSSPYIDSRGEIAVVQWRRFLTADDSAMSILYNQLKPDRTMFVPVLLAMKFLLLVPAVLVEPNTWGQIVGMALAELVVAVVTHFGSAFMNPWVNILHRLGSAHQLALLACLAAYNVARTGFALSGASDTVTVHDAAAAGTSGETAPASVWGSDPGWSMVTVTVSYLALAAAFTAVSFLNPVLRPLWERDAHRRWLLRFGLPPALLSPLYVGAPEGRHVFRKAEIVLPSSDDRCIARAKVKVLVESRGGATTDIAASRLTRRLGKFKKQQQEMVDAVETFFSQKKK